MCIFPFSGPYTFNMQRLGVEKNGMGCTSFSFLRTQQKETKSERESEKRSREKWQICVRNSNSKSKAIWLPVLSTT